MSQPPGYPPQPGDPYGQQGEPPQQPAWPPAYPPPVYPPPGTPQPSAPEPGMPPADPYSSPGSGSPSSPSPYAPSSGAPSSGAPSSGGGYAPTSGGGYQPTSGGGYGPGPYPAPGTEQPAYGAQPGYPPGGYPTQPLSPQPGYPQDPYGAGFPPPGYGPPPPPPPKKKRGLMITLILVAVLVLCGGGATGAYLLVNNLDGKGQASPTDAVTGFISAVFVDHDVDKASKFVCKDARNKAKLTKKIQELKDYEQQYKSPKFSWAAPTVETQSNESATLNVKINFSTADDRVAERALKILTVNKSGWWVCEVKDA